MSLYEKSVKMQREIAAKDAEIAALREFEAFIQKEWTPAWEVWLMRKKEAERVLAEGQKEPK